MNGIIRWINVTTVISLSFQNLNAQVGMDNNSRWQNHHQGGAFIENKGQIHDQHDNSRPDILFMKESSELSFFIRKNGISYQQEVYHRSGHQVKDQGKQTEMVSKTAEEHLDIDSFTINRIDITWLGYNSDYNVEAFDKLGGFGNYYLEHCPDGITGVRSYRELIFRNLFDGIDLRWYEKDGRLEYDFIVNPGADYREIQWEISGFDNISVNNTGKLVINTGYGEIVESAPVVIQDGKRIIGEWTLNANVVGFRLNGFDIRRKYVIDPIIVDRLWGTYYGGGLREYFWSCDTDDSSNVYVVGRARSSNLATSGVHQSSFTSNSAANYSAFLVKFTSGGERRWATYYGGTFWNEAFDVDVNNIGSLIYWGGKAEDPTIYGTTGSFQSTRATGADGFLACFSGLGTRIWGTYYGSNKDDELTAICMNGAGDVYITGTHDSTSSGMASSGAHQTTKGGGKDAYLAKFSGSGSRLWATYYGGSGEDGGTGLSVEGNSYVYLSGRTTSSSAIATSGTYQTSRSGSFDAFLVKFSSNGVRSWGTYFGGIDDETGNDICFDGSSSIYMTGSTYSNTNIASTGSYQTTIAGYNDAYLAKFSANGSRIWSSYYGGTWVDECFRVVVDTAGDIILGGSTISTNMGTYGSWSTWSPTRSALMTKFSPNGNRIWSTYYGSPFDFDDGYGLCVDRQNNRYFLVGRTNSMNSYAEIASSGAYQTSLAGDWDGFIAYMENCWLDTLTLKPASCDSFISPSGKVMYNSGFMFDTLQNQYGCDSLFFVYSTIIQTPIVGNVVGGMVCDSGIVNLSASSNVGKVLWYEDSTGAGPPVDTGIIFSIKLDSSKTYYVSAMDSFCESQRLPVQASVIPAVYRNIKDTACDAYLSPSGNYTFDSTGYYQDTLSSYLGCDSILVIDLTIIHEADTQVVLDGKSLMARASSAGFQWIDCSNNSVIPGETSKFFFPSENGSFAVVVTQFGCTDTSGCHSIHTIGMNEIGKNNIVVYPNPTSGEIILDLRAFSTEVFVVIENSMGQEIFTENFKSGQLLHIDIEAAAGLYILRLRSQGSLSFSSRILKKQD